MVISSIYVLDASVTAPWILVDEDSSDIEQMFDVIIQKENELLVPEIWSLECLNILKTAFRRKRISEKEVRRSLKALQVIPVKLVSLDSDEYSNVFGISVLYDLTSYDAAYFYLAQKMGANLITLDSDLLKLKEEHPFIFRPEEI